MRTDFNELLEAVKQKNVYIYGAGELGEFVFTRISTDRVLGFIDKDTSKQGRDFKGKSILSPESVLEKNSIIVIAVSDGYYGEIKSFLGEKYKNEEHRYLYYSYYLSLYEFVYNNKMFFNSISVSLTQICTLNCKHCSILTPHIKNKRHYDINALKGDLDLFFEKYDYVGNVGIIGGEPFIYPKLSEYILYLEKFKNKMLRSPKIVTNGTVIPDTDTISAMKKLNVYVSISDYSYGLPNLSEKIENLILTLENNNISYSVDRVNSWIDFGYTKEDKGSYSNEEMAEFYDSCEMSCRLLRDGNVYQCANAMFAVDAGIISEDKDNRLRLRDIESHDSKINAIKFDLMYQKKGYLTLCRKCYGYLYVNDNFVPVAEQI